MENKQLQKAGAHSQQFQVENLIIGVDEKRVREIFDEKMLLAIHNFTQEAHNNAIARIGEFRDSLVPKIIALENGIAAFADPSFQFLLVEAQKSAASTERIADYDLLAELLVNRIKNGGNRKIRAGISRAVEIVEDISDDALIGLTVSHSVNSFEPRSGNIHDGLDILDDLFGKIICGELPTGQDWLDHLDVLDAIRISPFGKMNNIQAIYSVTLEGYVAVGIKKNSEEYFKAIEILKNVGINPMGTLMQHTLNPDYVRLEISQKLGIDDLNITKTLITGNGTQIVQPCSSLERGAIKSIYDLYSQDVTVKEQNIQKFMDEWDKRFNLKMLREWWDNIPSGFQITSVGRVLAHANAQRCDKDLPSLN